MAVIDENTDATCNSHKDNIPRDSQEVNLRFRSTEYYYLL